MDREPEESYTVQEAAHILRTTERTVRRRLDRGDLEGTRDPTTGRWRAKAHYRRIIRTCWMKLVDKSLSPNSHNIPAFIAQAAAAQVRLDKLNGIEAPIKLRAEVESVADIARRTSGIPPEQRLRLVDEGM